MQRNYLLSLGALSLMFCGCETMGGSIGSGAATGALIGAGVGIAVDPGAKGQGRIKNVVVGSAAGAALGAGVGYSAGKNREESEKAAYSNGKVEEAKEIEGQTTGGEPTLLPPRVEAHFVPDQVRGNVFVPGHFEYRIVEPARWSR